MVDKNTPEKDPIEDLLVKTHVNVDDLEDKGDKVDVVDEAGKKEVEEAKEEIGADLDKEKEKTETQQEVKEELSVFGLITRTEVLIDKYKEFKRHAKRYSRNKEDKGYEKAFKGQVENRLRRLENIKRFLDKYEKKTGGLNEASLNRYNREINSIDNEVALFEQGRDEIVMEKTGGETPYTIDIHTYKDAKEIIKANEEVNRMLKKLDGLELDAALKTELKEELESLQRYLEASISGKIDAGTQPFQFKHYEDFRQLGFIDTNTYPIFDNKKDNQKNNKSTNDNQPNYVLDANGNPCPRTITDYNNLDEAWKRGGVMGAIDYGFQKTNMTPQQRQFWHGAGNLALIGGGIFLGWKALKSVFGIFSKDKEKRKTGWGWLAGIAGGTILLQGATGKNPIQAVKELFNGGGDIQQRISSLFGGGKNGVKTGAEPGPNTPPEAIAYVHGFAGVPGIFGGMTMEQIKPLVTKDKNGIMKINQAGYASLTDVHKNRPDIVSMLEKLKGVNEDDNDKYNIIHLTLGGMGMGYDKLQQGGTEKFDDYAVSSFARLKSINDFMVQKGYDKMNIELFRDDVKNYIANGDPSLVALEEAGLFKDGLKQKQTVGEVDGEINNFNENNDVLGLKAKVDLLTIPTDQKKILVAAGNILKTQTNNNNNIEFKEGPDGLMLQTYGEWTPINIATKTIPNLDFNNENIFFKSTMEMIKVANLTNYIKKLFRGRANQIDKPFEITNALDLIKLDGIGDLVFKEKNKDPNIKRYNPKKYDLSAVEVIDAGRFGDLGNLSPILNKYTKEYAEYLNTLGIWKQANKADKLPT
ncbi:MAG: hypothetical protein WAZ12_02455 [Candidatus Absconditicoccaceae bacterium]